MKTKLHVRQAFFLERKVISVRNFKIIYKILKLLDDNKGNEEFDVKLNDRAKMEYRITKKN